VSGLGILSSGVAEPNDESDCGRILIGPSAIAGRPSSEEFAEDVERHKV